MLQSFIKIVCAASLCTLMLAVASESQAQFSGNGRLFNSPVVSQLQNVRRLTQQAYSQPTYPTYQQPTCRSHSQPYYPQPTYPQPTVYVQPTQPKPAKPLTQVQLARKYTAEAKTLFLNRRYAEASKKLDEVVKRAPKDTNAYQFRALTHFAASDFKSAAADAYDALALGNTWTPAAVKSLYGPQNLALYSNQLQQLRRAADQQPSMQNHFLLAYHDLVNENWTDGKTQLEKVLVLQPQEPLSSKLLAAVNAKLAADKEGVAAQK